MLETGMILPAFTIPTDTRASLAIMLARMWSYSSFRAPTPAVARKKRWPFRDCWMTSRPPMPWSSASPRTMPRSRRRFRAKHGLTVELGADDGTDICEQFGVWVEKSMYGKTYMGIQRASFVIGPDGKIAAVWPKVKVPGHAEEVLETVRGL